MIESNLTLPSIRMYLSCPALQKERHQACVGEFREPGKITGVIDLTGCANRSAELAAEPSVGLKPVSYWKNYALLD